MKNRSQGSESGSQGRKKDVIYIGIDFDGVIAYNPFRVVRPLVVFLKRVLFGVKRTKFFIPQTVFQRLVWNIVFGASILPAKGVTTLKKLAKNKKVRLYVVTSRFDFMLPFMYKWLKKNNLTKCFVEIVGNKENEQPHIHKTRHAKRLAFDYYIEDNWDVVRYMHKKTPTHVCWIYNITDRFIPFTRKFPYLEKALEYIITKERIRIS